MENSAATSSDTIRTIADTATRADTESYILAHSETSSRSKKGKIFRGNHICRRILLAFLSRILFTVHAVLLISILVEVKCNPHYWALLAGVLALDVEMIVTLIVTKKGEWKWFSPTVFIYLCVAIPCIFLSELEFRENSGVARNQTGSPHNPSRGSPSDTVNFLMEPMEQIMILVLIMGRWLMPKGEMTQEQLAGLLRIYIGIGADILDLLQLVKNLEVGKNKNIAVVGLSLFSWALLQFTLVLTQTQSSAPKEMRNRPEEEPKAAVTKNGCWFWCTSEIWPLIISVGMQDGPFLAFRLYIITKQNVKGKNTMIFFICKNIMTVIIQIYSIIVVLRAHQQKVKNVNVDNM